MGDNISVGSVPQGGELARASKRYIAIIADMVRSRDVPRFRRGVLQKRFSALIHSLNRGYRKTIASRFVIT